ncbi:MAG: radical SAM protein [Deltaproteobacteria bacterium]|nr:radical SAM protein [Deltaproteobacteria bacterium]
MDDRVHDKIARIHLPVAPKCNIHCLFCERKYSSPKTLTPGPGTAARIISPREALRKTGAFLEEWGAESIVGIAGPGDPLANQFLEEWGAESIVGIAGPGDPLANRETFETLRLIRNRYPTVRLCLCTNGLNLPDSLSTLRQLNVQHLTVTINGVKPEIVARIQPRVRKGRQCLGGEDGAQMLIGNQLEGLERAASLGMFVKVNTVVVPEINGHHVETITRTVADLGACVYNPMPLIPRGSFKHMTRPSHAFMKELRKRCGSILPVFSKCKQCRADAAGIPGKELRSCKMVVTA